MSVHYSAFISYRHSEVDSQAASEIQKRLERFRVPRSIRKKTGKKRIGRIFRDKEELPLTSDLNDDIAEALANADYLIVICSPRTAESVWVQREIETFLKNHSLRQVLTVLAEGEPGDVIPEILRYHETIDPVTGELRRVPVEPLSCDWRQRSRRVRQEELSRLAAAMLGCTYDELRQRQRQYRLRRITAGFSVALAASLLLAAYFIRTSLTIQANYRQALENQSRYLAAESGQALEDGDRTTAILLALAALPDGETERPVVAEAELALGEAVGAYSLTTTPTAMGTFKPDGDPESFVLDDAAAHICILDDLNLISVWDTQTMRRLYTLHPDTEIDRLLTYDGRLLARSEESLYCYDMDTGTLLWRTELELSYGADNWVVWPDQNALLVGCDTESGDAVAKLDLETGEALQFFALPDWEDGSSVHLDYDGFWLSEDEGTLYTSVWYLSWDDDFDYMAFLDLEKGTWQYSDVGFMSIYAVCPLPDGGAAVAGRLPDDKSLFGDGSYTFSIFNMITLMESDRDIVCLDEKGSQVWENQVFYYQVSWNTELMLYPDGTLLCTTSNVCQRFDPETGETLDRGEATASIVCAVVEDEYARLVLYDGSRATYDYAEERCSSYSYFADTLVMADYAVNADGTECWFVCQNYGDRVLFYQRGEAIIDDTWEAFSGEQQDDSGYYLGSENYFVSLTYDDEVYLYSLEEYAYLWKVSLASEDRADYALLGIDEASGSVFLSNSTYEQTTLVTLSLSDGSRTDTVLSAETENTAGTISTDVTIQGDYALYGVTWTDSEKQEVSGGQLFVYNWRTSAVEQISLPWPVAALSVSGEMALAIASDGQCCLVSLTDGSVTTLSEQLPEEEYYTPWITGWSADGGLLAAAGEEQVWLWDTEGTLLLTIPLEGRRTVGLHFRPDADELLILCGDELLRYTMDGTLQSTTEIAVYTNASTYPDDVTWKYAADGDLALLADRILSMIDTDSWVTSAYAASCVGYDAVRDVILCDHNYVIGGFHRYTVEELIAKGRGIVGEAQLSESQISRYGIG